MPFAIDYTPSATKHLEAMRKRDQQIIYDAIGRQLGDRPMSATRHRKELRANALAPWELRVGDFRVFYDVDSEENRVLVIAVGHKVHNVLYVGGEEIQP